MANLRDRKGGCSVALALALMLWIVLAGLALLGIYLAYRAL